jgi:hypothetical protein
MARSHDKKRKILVQSNSYHEKTFALAYLRHWSESRENIGIGGGGKIAKREHAKCFMSLWIYSPSMRDWEFVSFLLRNVIAFWPTNSTLPTPPFSQSSGSVFPYKFSDTPALLPWHHRASSVRILPLALRIHPPLPLASYKTTQTFGSTSRRFHTYSLSSKSLAIKYVSRWNERKTRIRKGPKE